MHKQERSIEISLSREFFARPTLEVAPELLGKYLVRKLNKSTVLKAQIVEVEAYTQDDPACHAFTGKTPRSLTMFGEPGHAYVYLIYGMYHCLNAVTEPAETAGAVLIRAVALDNGNGPGKLCRLLQIDASHNKLDLCSTSSGLYIADLEQAPIAGEAIETSGRIGISRAREHPWRFYLKGCPYVSRPRG